MDTIDLLGMSVRTLAILIFISVWIVKQIYPLWSKNQKRDFNILLEKFEQVIIKLDNIESSNYQNIKEIEKMQIRIETLERENKEIKEKLNER